MVLIICGINSNPPVVVHMAYHDVAVVFLYGLSPLHSSICGIIYSYQIVLCPFVPLPFPECSTQNAAPLLLHLANTLIFQDPAQIPPPLGKFSRSLQLS